MYPVVVSYFGERVPPDQGLQGVPVPLKAVWTPASVCMVIA